MTGKTRFTEFAPAKINLLLHVVGRTANGYHKLQSLVVFAGILGDYIHATQLPHNGIMLEYEGPFAEDLPAAEDNLVMKAAQMLQQDGGDSGGVKLTLTKHMPVAGGIGGGSADAAAALRLLSRVWDVDLSAYSNRSITEILGADVPACLLSEASWMQGIGDEVIPLAVYPTLPILLVNPGMAVSTKQIFDQFSVYGGEYKREIELPIAFDNREKLIGYVESHGNCLQPVAETLYPEICEVLELIGSQIGCRISRMSGSGASCFGIFDNVADVEQAAVALKNMKPDWWVKATLSEGIERSVS